MAPFVQPSFPQDRNENPSLMDPLLVSLEGPAQTRLHDQAAALMQESAGFAKSIQPSLRPALADMVRGMNCYYSNLIEGHDTHPIDIERALNNDYSANPKKRDLQKEARAHVKVQQWIDAGGLGDDIFSMRSICEIHRRFYSELPEELRWVKDDETGENKTPIIPGELRDHDVKVGQHIAISAGAVPRFLERFHEVYGQLGLFECVVNAAAIHHRLVWIHPFIDGNGRVARLLSHALYLKILKTSGLWSISRGLARNVESYKTHLANCDLQRRNDLDGRGNLSLEELNNFSGFYLNICIDQVRFMETIMQPERLRYRILSWVDEEIAIGALPPQTKAILSELLRYDELPRSELDKILGVSDRHSRRLIAPLIERKIIVSENTRAPYRLAFPAELAERWMPGLFPEKPKGE